MTMAKIDKKYDDIIYVPEDTTIDLIAQKVKWNKDGEEKQFDIPPMPASEIKQEWYI